MTERYCHDINCVNMHMVGPCSLYLMTLCLSALVTGPPAPAAPPFLFTEVLSNSSVFLMWDDIPEPTLQYQVLFTGISTPNPVAAAFFQTQNISVMFQTSTIISGLLPGSTYNFSVRVDDSVAGLSPPVSAINTTLEGCEFALDRNLRMYVFKSFSCLRV